MYPHQIQVDNFHGLTEYHFSRFTIEIYSSDVPLWNIKWRLLLPLIVGIVFPISKEKREEHFQFEAIGVSHSTMVTLFSITSYPDLYRAISSYL